MLQKAGRQSGPYTATTSRPSCIGSRCSNPGRSRNGTALGHHRLIITAMARKAQVVRGWVGTRLRFCSRVGFWLGNVICVIRGSDGSQCWSAMIVVFGSFRFSLPSFHDMADSIFVCNRTHVKCGELAPRDCGLRPTSRMTSAHQYQSSLNAVSPLSKVKQNAAHASEQIKKKSASPTKR